MRVVILAVVVLGFLLAPVCHAQEWVGFWREGSSGYLYGLRADGELWAFNPNQPSAPPYSVGSFGPGPWVAVTSGFGDMFALKMNGEIWGRNYGGGGTPWLFCSLPSDKQWGTFVRSGDDMSAVMTRTGEVWAICSSGEGPYYIGSFPPPAPPTPSEGSTWGTVKGAFR